MANQRTRTRGKRGKKSREMNGGKKSIAGRRLFKAERVPPGGLDGMDAVDESICRPENKSKKQMDHWTTIRQLVVASARQGAGGVN